jgi:hypothetical protein
MLHVILKAKGRLLRPEGITEFRAAVSSIEQVKPFTRKRKGRLEWVKGHSREIKKLRDKAAKLRSIADQTEDKGKIKQYYSKANKLDDRARALEKEETSKERESHREQLGEIKEWKRS